jgi:hypothetical protein
LIHLETSASLVVSNKVGCMRTGIQFFAALAFIFFLTPLLRAANVQWPDKLGDWTADLRPINQPVGTLSPDLAKETGLTQISSKDYQAGGNRIIPLTLYAFKDSSGAYEAYSYLNGRLALADTNHTVLVNGNLVLHVGFLPQNSAEIPPVEKWLAAVSDHVASPPVATYLPEKGLDSISERYALGPLAFRLAAKDLGSDQLGTLTDEAGFDSHAESMFAKYKVGKDAATLLLIEYPTPQLAELHLRHLQRALADAKLTTSSIERKGSLLSIVLAPTSPEYAAKLRAGVNYETSVTWNEASQTATDPPIMSTVVKIFIATGVFMVVTVVIGIAFGGVRVITKRLFPGKVFDRKDQIEVLQLGLSGKPIDPTDLY